MSWSFLVLVRKKRVNVMEEEEPHVHVSCKVLRSLPIFPSRLVFEEQCFGARPPGLLFLGKSPHRPADSFGFPRAQRSSLITSRIYHLWKVFREVQEH